MIWKMYEKYDYQNWDCGKLYRPKIQVYNVQGKKNNEYTIYKVEEN